MTLLESEDFSSVFYLGRIGPEFKEEKIKMMDTVGHLLGDIAISNIIADEIFERIIQIVNDEVRNTKLELDEDVQNHRLSLLFPPNYPKEKRFKKLEELREMVVCKKADNLDWVGQYVLYHILAVQAIVLEELCGTTIVPFENRDTLNELLFARYGTLKDRYKFLSFYEDYDCYTRLMFSDLDFLELDDWEKEKFIEQDKEDN